MRKPRISLARRLVIMRRWTVIAESMLAAREPLFNE
jgi:hypothetical protein